MPNTTAPTIRSLLPHLNMMTAPFCRMTKLVYRRREYRVPALFVREREILRKKASGGVYRRREGGTRTYGGGKPRRSLDHFRRVDDLVEVRGRDQAAAHRCFAERESFHHRFVRDLGAVVVADHWTERGHQHQ